MLQTNTVGQTKKNLYLATAKTVSWIEYIQPVISWIRRKVNLIPLETSIMHPLASTTHMLQMDEYRLELDDVTPTNNVSKSR